MDEESFVARWSVSLSSERTDGIGLMSLKSDRMGVTRTSYVLRFPYSPELRSNCSAVAGASAQTHLTVEAMALCQ